MDRLPWHQGGDPKDAGESVDKDPYREFLNIFGWIASVCKKSNDFESLIYN